MKKKLTVNFVFILILFFIDRVSKFLIIKFNNETEEANIILTPFLNLNLVWNEGIAFGLLSFDDHLSYRLVTLFISIVILILFFMLYKAEKLNRVALIMVIGGATGNFLIEFTILQFLIL